MPALAAGPSGGRREAGGTTGVAGAPCPVTLDCLVMPVTARSVSALDKVRQMHPRATLHEVPLSRIDLSDRTFRIRLSLDIDSLQRSLDAEGQLVPVVLRTRGKSFQVVSGFRRVAAIQALGRSHVSALVYDELSDVESLTLAVADNSQRADFTDLDRGHAVVLFRYRHGYPLARVAELMGLERRQVARLERLTTLPDYVQHALTYGGVPTTHVLVLVDRLDPVAEELRVRQWLTRLRNTKLSVASLRTELDAALTRAPALTEPCPSTYFVCRPSGVRLRSLRLRLTEMTSEQRESAAAEFERLAAVIRESAETPYQGRADAHA